MSNLKFTESDADYLRLRSSFKADLERDAGEATGKKSWTEIDVIDDPDGEQRWMIARKEIRPGSVRGPVSHVTYLAIEELAELRRMIPELRLQNLPPFNPEVPGRLLRPQTDILHHNDLIVVCPRATQVIAATDFDHVAVAGDVDAVYNAPTIALDASAQQGILHTSANKERVVRMKRQASNYLDQAYYNTLGFRTKDNPSIGTLSPEQQFEYYRTQVVDFGRKEPEILREQGAGLQHMERMFEDIDEAARETETVSLDAFRTTIDSGGMHLPSTCEGAEEAIGRVGIGTRKYLKI